MGLYKKSKHTKPITQRNSQLPYKHSSRNFDTVYSTVQHTQLSIPLLQLTLVRTAISCSKMHIRISFPRRQSLSKISSDLPERSTRPRQQPSSDRNLQESRGTSSKPAQEIFSTRGGNTTTSQDVSLPPQLPQPLSYHTSKTESDVDEIQPVVVDVN